MQSDRINYHWLPITLNRSFGGFRRVGITTHRVSNTALTAGSHRLDGQRVVDEFRNCVHVTD